MIVRTTKIRGRSVSVMVEPKGLVKNFWELMLETESPWKTDPTVVDWDRDGSVCEFTHENGDKTLVEYI